MKKKKKKQEDPVLEAIQQGAETCSRSAIASLEAALRSLNAGKTDDAIRTITDALLSIGEVRGHENAAYLHEEP